MEILNPKSQLDLFGYNKLFDSFITLYKKKKLPNVMLFSGAKGLGKAMREVKDASNDIKKEIRDSATNIKDDFDITK